ncbi:class I SAM-dependent methyltransferase [Sphingobacterium sp. Mn56C]|uniref:class I SAM-dependent methyltransferase n=1 Tax=Sphingobacterium sp. Mn56C TaxID=3395261 RepID=UPI003BDD52AA
MKDNFSSISDKYAIYRPTYPQSIYDFIYPLIQDKDAAWDCATGNGQIAQELAHDFLTVEATDISQAQLDNAQQSVNINYSVQPAEKTSFKDNSFDLITVGQAIQWFDLDKFYHEVKRVGKENSLIAVIGYEMSMITPEIDEIINRFYNTVVDAYWEFDKHYVQQHYQTLPFPFRELETPAVTNIKLWKLDHLLGYLNTWSAVKNYEEKNGVNPINEIKDDLIHAWGTTEIRKVNFPIFFRVGRIK